MSAFAQRDALHGVVDLCGRVAGAAALSALIAVVVLPAYAVQDVISAYRRRRARR